MLAKTLDQANARILDAAIANLDIVEREGLPKRALQLESDLARAMAPLAGHPLVEEVRAGTGVLASVQLRTDALADDPSLAPRVVAACRRDGVMTRTLATGGLQISPALVIDDDGLTELRDGIGAALDDVA